MRPLASLPLNKRLAAVIWLALAPSVRAQTRVGSVETGITTPGQSGSLSSSLTPGGVPQLLTLTLLSPTLNQPPGTVFTPAPLFAPAPLALALPVPLAAAAVPAALKPVKPAAYAPAVVEDKSVPSLLAPVRALLQRDAPDGIEKLDDRQLFEMTRRLAGESVEDDKFSLTYLRPDKPVPFAPEARAKYADALGYGTGSASRATAVVDAAASLLQSAGIGFRRIKRDNDGAIEESLVISPDSAGSALNRLAWNIQSRHGAALEYAPARLGYAAVASYNHQLNVMFLPHFGRSSTYEAILHEAHHSNYAARQAKGDLSPFQASAYAHQGQSIVPRAAHYPGYASMEELTGHAKTVKQMLAELRRKPATTWWDAYAVDVEALKLDDLSRSASILAHRILVELKDGTPVLPLPPGHWALAQLGPIPGGTWHSIRLPWCEFFIPVMDEAPAPRKKGLAGLFSRKPETPGEKAARRTALALQGWVKEAWPLVRSVRARLNEEPPDWNALNALADKVALAGPKAEKSFKASR